jgi:nicotinamidase-related amidase
MQTALILIDIQNDYFENGSMPLHDSAEAARNASKVLKLFREDRLPIVHIQHLATREGANFFLPGTTGAEIHRDVAPLADEKIIVKHYPNSFRETGLLEHLQVNGITRLVVAGMMTQMCVDATVRAAKDFGFEVMLIGDACATRDLVLGGRSVAATDVQESFLAALAYFYATVIGCGEFLERGWK